MKTLENINYAFKSSKRRSLYYEISLKALGKAAADRNWQGRGNVYIIGDKAMAAIKKWKPREKNAITFNGKLKTLRFQKRK